MTRKRRRTAKRGSEKPGVPPTTPRGAPDGGSARIPMSRRIWVGASLAIVVVLAGVGFYLADFGRPVRDPGAASVATFVGSETCAGCHPTETRLWDASQHKGAMQHATGETVLGDFGDASFDHYGLKSRFFSNDGKFLVETDDSDGKLAVFEVKYTFGLDPLQQYLVEFPDGRLQALSIAWDNRPKDDGGQRWFHLYPDEQIRHDDVLHWTRLNQNWNFMCAECHSTGLRKNYDAATDRFATTWAEISVGCEACHGQGSRHAAWARDQRSWWPFGRREDPGKGLLVRFDERRNVAWPIDPRSGSAQRSVAPATLRKEVETCGLCHARRAGFHEDWIPGRWLSETHVVSPLTRETYHPDGQIRDVEEAYNYLPFKQGRMFAAGVTCSDCHEPHSAKLRASGDGVCLQCHAPDQFSSVAHRHHAAVDPPPACTACHMQTRTYMVVDPRHDHAFRIPRPDLSVALGTPNACNTCHADKTAHWAVAALDAWYGSRRKGFQAYATAFHAAWAGETDAAARLAAVVADGNTPAVARASALTELRPHLSSATLELARRGLGDHDPMVRIGALDMLENFGGTQLWRLVSPLLADPVRGVRIRTASLLAAVPTAGQPPADRERFERAAGEFIAAQRTNADRPEARATLGSFFARRGLAAEAEAEYNAALQLSPQYATAAINLADLYRQLGRDGEGEGVLRDAIGFSPRDAGAHHALGLVLARLRKPDALAALAQAAELDPANARYLYVYAIALNSSGRSAEAIALLKHGLTVHPGDRDILLALVTISREAGDADTALEYAEQLARSAPDDPRLSALVGELRRQVRKPPAQ